MALVSVLAGVGATTGSSSFFHVVAHRLRGAIEARRTRSRLRWELDQCSDRELADMGVSRADIDAIVADHLGA
jgi:uncharacterized protein YjiS (DUF1127 family)